MAAKNLPDNTSKKKEEEEKRKNGEESQGGDTRGKKRGIKSPAAAQLDGWSQEE